MNNETVSTQVIEHYLKETGIQEHLDSDINEVVINKPYQILTEKGGSWKSHKAEKSSFENLSKLVDSLTTYSNLDSISRNSPIRSLALPTGERVQIIAPPACEDGKISITIRKPSLERFTLDDYVQSGRFSKVKQVEKTERGSKELLEIYQKANKNPDEAPLLYAEFIKKAVEERLNFLIVGGTGSGKTTVAKAIADLFPKDRRIITIEDVHEMNLQHENKVHLFFSNTISSKVLIESSMRMKPDHIFLAELRGDEAWSYLEALNTGHRGSVTTIHANSAMDSFHRLASIVKQSEVGLTLDIDLIMKTIKDSIDVVMFFEKTHLKEFYYNHN